MKKFSTSGKNPVEIGARNLMEGFRLNAFALHTKYDPGSAVLFTRPDNGGQDNGDPVSSPEKVSLIIAFPIEMMVNNISAADIAEKIFTQNPAALEIRPGRYIRGSYTTPGGSLFNENSMAMEIIFRADSSPDFLPWMKTWNLKELLVKDCETERIYLYVEY